jgi:hypothetical protein
MSNKRQSYRWLVTNRNGLYRTNVEDWKLESSGPPEEEFGWFDYFGPYSRNDGMDCYLRVKLDDHQLDYIEKVNDVVKQATGIHQDPLLAIVLDYSAPSLVWISYSRGDFRNQARVELCASLEVANAQRVELLCDYSVVKWGPPRVFEMLLNPCHVKV